MVLIALVSATAMSALTLLAMGGDYGAVLSLPTAALAIMAGSLAAGRARVSGRRAFLAERVVLTLIIWIGLIAQTLRSLTLPFSGGGSAADVGIWLLGGPWAWAGLGAAAFGLKRIYEREAVLARLDRRRDSRRVTRWPVLASSLAVAAAVVAPLPFLQAGALLTAMASLLAAAGALSVGLAFPSGVRSWSGRGLLLAGCLALAASVSPFMTVLVGPFVRGILAEPFAPADEVAGWLGLAASYTLLGAWLLARPFADHEWRLRLSHTRNRP